MKPDIIVLGAGMIGVATALHLQARGHPVVLLDRGAPGAETSYGNAGVIQREAVEPYAFPRGAADFLKAAFRLGLSVNYHLGALPAFAAPLARYWWFSAPSRYGAIAQAYSQLIAHSTGEHRPLIEAAGADDLVNREGYRVAFRSARIADRMLAEYERIARRYDLSYAPLDPGALARAEPNLLHKLAGGVHWRDPWSVSDPGGLVARYAELFRTRGGTIARGDALSLGQTGSGWRVVSDDGPLEAPLAVIALGPWSSAPTRRLGYRLPLFIKRGYHRHYRRADGKRQLALPLFDAEQGLVMAPMKQGLRITTGAEFARIDAPSTPVQLHRAERAAAQLLELGEPVEAQPWRGSRPCTVDMLPIIGEAPRHRGLWLHFGHAHQGFTLGPATGRLIAEMIGGEKPYVDPAPYAPGRFGA